MQTNKLYTRHDEKIRERKPTTEFVFVTLTSRVYFCLSAAQLFFCFAWQTMNFDINEMCLAVRYTSAMNQWKCGEKQVIENLLTVCVCVCLSLCVKRHTGEPVCAV